jgi:hypothetical protein
LNVPEVRPGFLLQCQQRCDAGDEELVFLEPPGNVALLQRGCGCQEAEARGVEAAEQADTYDHE